MTASNSRPPFCSIVAILCAAAFWSLFYFLTTAAGRAFNEDVFGRFYTLGALLMMAAYGVVFVGLLAGGAGWTFLAFRREERPSWFPKVALGANLVAPVVYFAMMYI